MFGTWHSNHKLIKAYRAAKHAVRQGLLLHIRPPKTALKNLRDLCEPHSPLLMASDIMKVSSSQEIQGGTGAQGPPYSTLDSHMGKLFSRVLRLGHDRRAYARVLTSTVRIFKPKHSLWVVRAKQRAAKTVSSVRQAPLFGKLGRRRGFDDEEKVMFGR